MPITLRDVIAAKDIAAHPELLRDQLFTSLECPWCHAALALDLNARVGPADDGRLRRVTVACCSGCEFVLEIEQ